MSKQALRNLVTVYVKMVEKGKITKTREVYSALYNLFPQHCEHLGLTLNPPIEAKWTNQIRYGLRDAQDQGLILHVGLPKSGLWKRL